MTTIKFISTDYLKENTILEMNVDDSKLTPLIIRCQRMYLQQTLGSSFYNHLSDAVANSTLTTAETNLIKDFIQPMVAEYVVYEAIPQTHFKMTNKGNVKQNSEWSESSQLDEIKYMRNAIKDSAEFFATRLAKYLCDNSEDFPAWNNRTLPENLERDGRPYFNGVFIEKNRSNDGCCD